MSTTEDSMVKYLRDRGYTVVPPGAIPLEVAVRYVEDHGGTVTFPNPVVAPPDGHRDGETYEAEFDRDRLNAQARRVFDVIASGRWLTLADISLVTGDPEPSVSARLRDFRKRRFGRMTVERRRVGDSGLWEYRLVAPEPAEV